MAITTRAGKGSALTHAEVDTNFTDLRDGVDMMVPKTQGKGIKVDSLGTPDWGWADIVGEMRTDPDDVNRASYASYRNGIRQLQFDTTSDEALALFHMPHDYAMGTDIHVHAHWSHTSATVTGGSVTWSFESTYAMGHDQAAFPATKTITVLQNAKTGAGGQYRHMIAEGALSVSGGSGTQLDTNDLEPDGLVLILVRLNNNNMTDSVTVPDPFIHTVDLHYQTTGIKGTKAKDIASGDFWT